MTEDNYRPQSPDLTTFQSPFPPPHPVSDPPITSPIAQRASYDASPFFTPQYQPPPRPSQQYIPPGFPEPQFDPDMARRSSRISRADAPADFVPTIPDVKYEEPEPEPEEPEVKPRPSDVEVKTKFPVARIKRIMQADEDVGKVAQVTPIAVSKALELFMISLVTKAAKEAKDRNSKRVTASHLKQAVSKDEVLDFLADIIAKVPDQPSGRKHDDDGSDQNEPKRKRGGRRPKDDSD